MPQYVQICDAEHLDVQTGVCDQPYWAQQVSMLPPLTIGEGTTIAMLILMVWAIAWGYKQLGPGKGSD